MTRISVAASATAGCDGWVAEPAQIYGLSVGQSIPVSISSCSVSHGTGIDHGRVDRAARGWTSRDILTASAIHFGRTTIP